jgi:ABC-type transport system involved in multi-copper enzyme maturation permease subunit
VKTFATLVRRHLARLSADRVTLIVIALASVAAILGAVATTISLNNAPGGSSDLGARVRTAAWEDGTALFNGLLFVLAIQLGASHLSSEMRRGTLFSWLARPLSRGAWTSSTWTAGALLLLGLEAARSMAIYIACWWIDGQPPAGMLVGALVLASGSILLYTMVFLVAAAAPAPYAVALGIASYILGSLAWQGVLRGSGEPGTVEMAAIVIPLIARHGRLVQGALLGTEANGGALWWVLAYRLGWTCFLLALASFAFSRRDLSPRG